MRSVTDTFNMSSLHTFRSPGRAVPDNALHPADREGAAREEARHVIEKQDAKAR